MPAMARVPPRSRALSAPGTSSPAGANMIAPSSGSGGASARPADRVHAELASQRLVVLTSREDVYPETLGQGELGGQVGAAAEAVDPEATAVRHVGALQGAVADDAGAEQGSGRLVGQAVGNPVGVGLVDQTLLGVATVHVPAGEGRVQAQVLPALTAEPAAAVRPAEPGHTDAIAGSEARRLSAERVDHPDDLVARGHLRALGRQVAFGEVQVGTADAAAGDPHADLTRTGLEVVALDPQQRMIIERPGSVDHPCVHGPHCAAAGVVERNVGSEVGPTMVSHTVGRAELTAVLVPVRHGQAQRAADPVGVRLDLALGVPGARPEEAAQTRRPSFAARRARAGAGRTG